MPEEPDSLGPEMLRAIRATRAEHTAAPARLDYRVLATDFNITGSGGKTPATQRWLLPAILEHGARPARLEQRTTGMSHDKAGGIRST